MEIKHRIWIEHKGYPIIGEGRMELLKAVERFGSLNRASKELGLSFRAAWGKIKSIEQRLGIKVLVGKTGGAGGGGSRLTSFGKELLNKFEALNNEAEEELKKIFTKHFPHELPVQNIQKS